MPGRAPVCLPGRTTLAVDDDLVTPSALATRPHRPRKGRPRVPRVGELTRAGSNTTTSAASPS